MPAMHLAAPILAPRPPSHRLRPICRPPASARAGLVGRQAAAEKTGQGDASPRIGFVFAGQGSQWPGDGARLYDIDPTFRGAVDEVDGVFAPLAGWSISELLAGGGEHPDMDECYMAQPVLFALQVAMCKVLEGWGVEPCVTLGHSAGEQAAVWSAGALPLHDMVRVMHVRAVAQQEAAGSGRLLVVGTGREALEMEMAEGGGGAGVQGVFTGLEVACDNSPKNTVLAGAAADVARAAAHLKEAKVFHCLLPGNVAFHSSRIDPAHSTMDSGLGFLPPAEEWGPTPLPVVSTVTGRAHVGFDRDHWWAVARAPALFRGAVSTAISDHAPDLLVEVSTAPSLRSPVRQCLPNGGQGEGRMAYLSALHLPSSLDRASGNGLTEGAWREAEGRWREYLASPPSQWRG